MSALDQPMRVMEQPTSIRWLVGVVIPARDEASTVADCLEAIIDSLNFCPDVGSSWIHRLSGNPCGSRPARHQPTPLRRLGVGWPRKSSRDFA
jgi:hypothetical protein